jgi:hypothetical protein
MRTPFSKESNTLKLHCGDVIMGYVVVFPTETYAALDALFVSLFCGVAWASTETRNLQE